MVITNEFKVIRTYDEIRSVLSQHRPAIEVNSYTEEFFTLSQGESRTISASKGVFLVSPDSFVLKGDINLTIEKYFACNSELVIEVENVNENTLEIYAYILG